MHARHHRCLPLPAIRAQPAAAAGGALWANVKLYGDESYTNFFRRLTFRPGWRLAAHTCRSSLKIRRYCTTRRAMEVARTGAPRHEEGEATLRIQEVRVQHHRCTSTRAQTSRGRLLRSCLGTRRRAFAVRFSPVLYELRPGVAPMGGSTVASSAEPPAAVLERGIDGDMRVEVVGPLGGAASTPAPPALMTPQKTHTAPIETPTPTRPGSGAHPAASPALRLRAPPMDLRPPTPAASQPSTPAPAHSQSGFFFPVAGEGEGTGNGHRLGVRAAVPNAVCGGDDGYGRDLRHAAGGSAVLAHEAALRRVYGHDMVRPFLGLQLCDITNGMLLAM